MIMWFLLLVMQNMTLLRVAPKGRGRHPRKAHQKWLAPIRPPGATVGRGSPAADNHAINFELKLRK